MAVTIPYTSADDFSAGAIYDPTAANFPCCKHFWSCPQSDIGKDFGSGTGGLTDLMGRANLLKSTGVALAAPAAPDGYSVFPNQAGSGTTASAALVVPTGTQATLLVSVTTVGATSGFSLGDMTNGGCIGHVKANVVTDSSGNQVNGTAFTIVSGTVGRGTLIRTWNGAATASTGQSTIECNATTTATTLVDAATTGAAIPTAWGSTDFWACAAANTNLYGVALFIFASIPTDVFLKGLVAWMTYHWTQGKKWLPPQLKGIS